MSIPKLELISFKLCPFVQRTVITLLHKDVPYSITYIDLNDPPAWFREVSPLGKVPVLKVDDSEVLFESAVIQEYVDEITPPSLMPEDPLVKARNRAWIGFGGELLMAMQAVVKAQDEAAFNEARDTFCNLMARLEEAHSGEDYFNGDRFALIDAAYAPLFMRLDLIRDNCAVDLLEKSPKLRRWADTLAALPSVQHSVVDEFPHMYRMMLTRMGGHLSTLLQNEAS